MIAITVVTVGPFLYTTFIALKSPGQGIYDGLLPTDRNDNEFYRRI